MRSLNLKALALFGILLAKSGLAYADRPERIVSLNLCADQYLMVLADRDQVASLTHHAQNPELSYQAKQAESWPVSRGSAEELMKLQPDLVIASKIRRPAIRAFLSTRNVQVVEIGPAHSYEDIIRQARLIGDAIGQPERADAFITDMDKRLKRSEDRQSARALTAAHYQRRGFLTGSNTLFSDIMAKAGLQNIAASLGAGRTQHISMETLLYRRPDVLIISSPLQEGADLGSDLLKHPALRDIYSQTHLIDVPESLTICGGPSYPAAVEALSEALANYEKPDF